MFSISVLLMLASACDLLISPAVPYRDVSQVLSSLAPTTSSYTLCLTSSLSEGAFSLETTVHLRANVTIQYLLHRSECLSCSPQTLWLRGRFAWLVFGGLTFRNVRITGQRLIWEECEEEWCTHCLAPPYLWPGQVDFTVIDHHPSASPSDPYYEASLCQSNSFVFFSLFDSTMNIENCAIDNIRIRALSFIELAGTSSLLITNTSIVRMDFTRSFINGNTEEVRLNGLYVAEFNRGHAYVSDYQSDFGFLCLLGRHFSLTSSLFEHNLQLLPNNGHSFYNKFVDIKEFKSMTFEDIVFRNSMHAFSILNYYTFFFSLQILNCRFEEDFSEYAYLSIMSPVPGEVRITDCVFRNITTRGNSLFQFQLAYDSSVLELSGTTFVNIVAYLPLTSQNSDSAYYLIMTASTIILRNIVFQLSTGSQPNFINTLVSEGLINDSPEVYTDWVERPPLPCLASIVIVQCSSITFQNVSLIDSICDIALMISDSIHPTMQMDVAQMVMARVVGGMWIIFNLHENFHGRISSSRFEAVPEIALTLNGTIGSTLELVVEDCDFTGSGIAFLGTRLEVLDSRFIGISSVAGAVDCMALGTAEAQPGATLRIEHSSFVGNRGQQQAADVSIRTNNYVVLLDVVLRACNFTHFYATSGGSIYIERIRFKKAEIESCRFEGGEADEETWVISTTHVKGTLSLEDVLFISLYIPKAYLLKVISPNIPSLDLQTLTNLTRVSVLNCTYKAAVLLKGQY